jgi:tetratricopeptide (TPR) repeat protein
MQRDPQVTLSRVEEGLALFHELHYQPGVAQALNIIGEITRLNSDYQRAKQVYEECLAMCQQTGEVRHICYLYHNLGFIAQHEGDYVRAAYLVRQSLQLSHNRNAVQDIATALATLASAVGMMGQPQDAARLLGAAETAFERIGAFFLPSDTPKIIRITSVIRAQLGDASFDATWVKGRRMTLEQAVAYALSESV